jgi:hypothetical protein
MTTGLTNAAGALQGTWTAPARISGENGKDGDPALESRYRGWTTDIPAGAVVKTGGTIWSITVNPNDWILYRGEVAADIWAKYYLYQWSGSNWEKLDTSTNPTKYMDVLSIITKDNAPPGVFSDVFCQVLFAQQAAIDTLASKVITLLEGGAIQSQDYKSGDKGFRIDSNGNAEFNNAEIRGNIYTNFNYTDYAGFATLMRGAVRGVVVFRWNTAINGVQIERKTANIDSIVRLDVGRYVLWTPDCDMAMLGAVVGYYSTNSVTVAEPTDSNIIHRFSSAIGMIASRSFSSSREKNGLWALPFSCVGLDNGAFQDIGNNILENAVIIILG